ncbi:MAG: energy-coupling factor ABC transporter permease [Alphaproteobacteria bacterium]|nr:energy-coupling factor ABC transporter permease [Alphaproteobacteria bacterium]MBU0805402.1 energy-coupling factor ABC transporter permease [Alphaproteobacteria bacterium]MBU0873348.1 energy-coupling factor ABC transporter permease [Alphaproteobacteria bacterium]MBU1401424.1 energy-coupling factor ABC transporter permease [Alphaproteobacteria bacterium]MBU1592159.1 energy-coupling factor ABC transporter permease [Alphaproteobacteria bacterium]
MHIEPGIVTGTKIIVSYATAAGSAACALRLAIRSLSQQHALELVGKSAIATGLVFTFFEVFPHHAVGVSEVHLILGSTLFLLFGAAPSAFGLAIGLLIQGFFFAPFDLPQYGMNVTTLLVPLFAVKALASRIVPEHTPYVDLEYRQVLALSIGYQGGIVAWVAFWAFYGHGLSADTLSSIAVFGGAYMLVIVVEPLVDLAMLAAAKAFDGLRESSLVEHRLYGAA